MTTYRTLYLAVVGRDARGFLYMIHPKYANDSGIECRVFTATPNQHHAAVFTSRADAEGHGTRVRDVMLAEPIPRDWIDRLIPAAPRCIVFDMGGDSQVFRATRNYWSLRTDDAVFFRDCGEDGIVLAHAGSGEPTDGNTYVRFSTVADAERYVTDAKLALDAPAGPLPGSPETNYGGY